MPFTDDELALLDAIHADPRSDAPRIAYAFWLQQHGFTGYADFIRLDLRLCNEVLNDDLTEEDQYKNWRVPQDADRYSHLESICAPWAEPLPRFADKARFDRGVFVVEVPDGIDYAELLPAMASASPRLRYSLSVTEATQPSFLDMIGTGKAGIIHLRPILQNHEGTTRERHSASLIGAMRVLFGSPHAHLLESVTISMRKILTEEAKATWTELAPSFLPVPWA